MRIKEFKIETQREGAYDALYASTNLLWPNKPGRMITAAAEAHPPGRSLDLGCGDGKNLVFLERLGWSVDAIDISPLALRGLGWRLQLEDLTPKGEIRKEDAVTAQLETSAYDLAICYGLYHCLTDEELLQVHDKVVQAIKPGGLFAFAVFNDNQPVPENHRTGSLFLRPENNVQSMCPGWEALSVEYGEITEAHPPLVPIHSHALTWGLLRKPSEV